MTQVRLALLPALLLGAGLTACAYPADPYYTAAPVAPAYSAPAYAPGYGAPPPVASYGSPYAAPMPALIGQGEYQGRAAPGPAYAAVPVDSYCREAYAAAAGAQQEAALTGSYEAAARAGRADGFYRRDC